MDKETRADDMAKRQARSNRPQWIPRFHCRNTTRVCIPLREGNTLVRIGISINSSTKTATDRQRNEPGRWSAFLRLVQPACNAELLA
jgi:hypothetical protein